MYQAVRYNNFKIIYHRDLLDEGSPSSDHPLSLLPTKVFPRAALGAYPLIPGYKTFRTHGKKAPAHDLIIHPPCILWPPLDRGRGETDLVNMINSQARCLFD